MNITKAPWIILSDILISATVINKKTCPLAVAQGYGAFPEWLFLGVCLVFVLY